jgi:hypothetical protein
MCCGLRSAAALRREKARGGRMGEIQGENLQQLREEKKRRDCELIGASSGLKWSAVSSNTTYGDMRFLLWDNYLVI